jgi:DNA-binding GntR family transcriptional regulator
VIVLDRVRYADDEAIICSRDVMSHAMLADVAESAWEGSLLDILEAHGQRPVMSTSRFSATTLPAHFAVAVPLRAEDPWLLARQVSRSAAGVPVVTAHDYYRGDLFSFDVVRHQHERTASR